MISSSQPKSLLYLSVYDPHVPLTGGGVRGAQFVKNLAQRFELDLIYIDGSGQPPIPEFSEKFAHTLNDVRTKQRIEFSQLDYFVFSRQLHQSAQNLLDQNHYDFMLCDYGLSAVYGLLLSRKYEVPFIYCSHNLEYRLYLDKIKWDKRRLLFVPYVYWAEKAGVKRSDILVPITKDDADFYTRWTTPDKMLVIPQGFDDAVFNPFYEPPQNDPKIVLFCGNFNIDANREVVPTVMTKILGPVLSQCPNVKFRFVGANPPQDVQHPNVEFMGFVEDYPRLLKQADLFISPIQQGRGSPTKIFEALACGKTVIATPTGARSLERDYQTLRIYEVEQFADAICAALRQNEPVTTVDFDKLKSRYAWRDNIMKLADRIETETYKR